MVKKELSEDAIILSSEEKKGIRPFVEVTAAIDYENANGDCAVKMEQLDRSPGENPEEDQSKTRFSMTDNSLYEIRKEIGGLKKIMENMKNTGYHLSLPPEKKMILHFLMERSIREEFALRLCEKAKDINHIPLLISNDIKVKSRNTDTKAVMLIGPTGVGKTTTIAKLSALAIKEGKKAAIVNLDTYRIGAIEQIRIYSRIMGIPLSIVSQGKELRESLLRYSGNRDIIFIDTTGRNPRDEVYINELLSACETGVPIELHLLMSASCDDEFMIDAYRFYRRLPIDYIAFTKVDEAVRYGALYNMLLTYQKPVAFITTGQKVPNDIKFITPDRLSNLILRGRRDTS